MKDSTFWKRQYSNFIKETLCCRKEGYLAMARSIDDEIESLWDREIPDEDMERTLLFLLINDAFNQVDPIGMYPSVYAYEYDIYAWEIVALYERSDEIGFYWQLPMYLQ